MKLHDIKPIVTLGELQLLHRADKIHEDPNLPINPDLQHSLSHLMKMGLLRMIRGDQAHYELTERGTALINTNK